MRKTDLNNPQFGLNYEYLKNDKDVSILTNKTITDITSLQSENQWGFDYQPMLGDKLIFDLENTLVFTDNLNTKSYNLSLEKNNQKPIIFSKRLTRSIIKEYLNTSDDFLINKIIEDKQKIFFNLINEVKPNRVLVDLIKKFKQE